MSATKEFSEKRKKEWVSFCNLFTFTNATGPNQFIISNSQQEEKSVSRSDRSTFYQQYIFVKKNIMKVDRVHPTKEQLADLMNYPKDQPVTMVNIIKFKTKTEDGTESGKAAYQRYLKNATPFIAQAGAKVVWRGNVAQTVIGDATNQADVIFMVEYPSVQHFLDMVNSSAYQAIAGDRSIALTYGGLIACTPF